MTSRERLLKTFKREKTDRVGKGVVDFTGQFRALIKDGYQGTMSLEKHYRRPDGNRMESTRECLDGLLKILESV
jgi:sugar phosphate isomerase/epimerase